MKLLVVFAILAALYVIVGLEEGDKCGGGWASPSISVGECIQRQAHAGRK